MTALPRRAVNWTRRKLQTLPIVRTAHTARHAARVRAHSTALPPMHPDDRPLLETLEKTGVCLVPVADLGWPQTDAMLRELEHLVEELRGTDGRRRNHVGIGWDRLATATAVRDWGMSDRALAFAENYLGLPVFYGGTQVRRELATGGRGGVRQWHLDTEDHRVLKLILYANDVTDGGGPFEYLDRASTQTAVERLGYTTGLVSDEALRAARIPPEGRAEATASRFTAVLVDAARLLHRAQPPRTCDRYTATFCWISVFGHRDHHPKGRVVPRPPTPVG